MGLVPQMTRNNTPARPPRGARRYVFLFGSCLLLALASPAAAGIEKQEGPPPWRVGGRVGFTLDASAFPDSSGLQLEVDLRVPPATILQLARDAEGDAKLHAEVKVRGRYGSRDLQSEQDFTISASDTALGQGKVLVMRFPAAPGPCEIQARLDDIFSKRRGLLYTGRDVNENASVAGVVEIPRPQAGRDMGDIEFLWPTHGERVGLAFVRNGRVVVPNPERLYGLFAGELHAAFVARAKPGDARPWHYVARVFDAKGDGVAQVESTSAATRILDGDLSFDMSKEPAGAYDLEVKAWQDGDAGALLRRSRFSLSWKSDTWLRNSADLTDEVHFLLDGDGEDAFAVMQPGEQERYLDEFWKLRDPTPETAFNEAYATFRERVDHANTSFHHIGIEKGMFSDQGRTYIRYGEPTEILHQVIPAGDETLTQQLDDISATEDRSVGEVRQKGLGGDMRPFEVWVYEGDIPLPPDADPRVRDRRPPRRRIVFLFVDQHGTGNYVLRYSTE